MGLALPTPESVSDSTSFSERDPGEVVDDILEEVIGGSESKFMVDGHDVVHGVPTVEVSGCRRDGVCWLRS